MDEFIEYEYARDCIEIDDGDDAGGGGSCVIGFDGIEVDGTEEHQDEEFLYTNDDYEIIEALDDEDEEDMASQHTVDIKPELLQHPEENDHMQTMKTEYIEGEEVEEDHLIEDDLTENGYEEVQELDYDESHPVERLDEETGDSQQNYDDLIVPEKLMKAQKPEPKTTATANPEEVGKKSTPGQRRYMLFDELVACIVDHDPDGTPIVEFSISNSECDEKLPVECGICPDVMPRSKISKHLKTHLVPGTNRYQCIYCEETYKDCKYLAGHARRHMGIRPYVCEICKLYFSTKQDLRVHNQRRHQEKDHICEVCGKTFAQNTQLKRHREATHEKKRRFQCEHCPKSYYKNFSLQEHVRAVHMGKRRMIVCPFCGMQCRDAHKMARHRKQMHLHQTHFECTICNEEFTDINYFDAHKRSIQCRNNTKRKHDEEEAQRLKQQQMDEEQGQLLEPKQEHIIVHGHQEPTEHYITHFPGEDEDIVEHQQVQIINESDIKHLLPTHRQSSEQFILNSDLLQHHKVEVLHPDDVADDEELVYEITIDSNE